jgi:hypothetical protein
MAGEQQATKQVDIKNIGIVVSFTGVSHKLVQYILITLISQSHRQFQKTQLPLYRLYSKELVNECPAHLISIHQLTTNA